MRAGELRHVIYADEPIIAQSDAGEETVVFTEVFAVNGSIEPIAGNEALRAGEILASADTRICLRWSPETARITAKWRLRSQDVTFNLKRVSPVLFRHREIEIWATSGLNEG